jgi:hypothetical protein
MKKLLLLLLLAGCASYSGTGLVPGKDTLADVKRVMGEPQLVRQAADGGQILWYPRQPYGRESYAARIQPNGTLAGIEQRLTSDNIGKIRLNETHAEEVLDVLGPPYRVYDFPRLERKAWEYYVQTFPTVPQLLYVQVSPDNVVREVIQVDERAPRNGLFFGFGGFGVGF